MARKKFERNDNDLAIACYRLSSHPQKEALIDQQKELAREWADANGFTIVKEYVDAAISGTKEDRPACPPIRRGDPTPGDASYEILIIDYDLRVKS